MPLAPSLTSSPNGALVVPFQAAIIPITTPMAPPMVLRVVVLVGVMVMVVVVVVVVMMMVVGLVVVPLEVVLPVVVLPVVVPPVAVVLPPLLLPLPLPLLPLCIGPGGGHSKRSSFSAASRSRSSLATAAPPCEAASPVLLISQLAKRVRLAC